MDLSPKELELQELSNVLLAHERGDVVATKRLGILLQEFGKF